MKERTDVAIPPSLASIRTSRVEGWLRVRLVPFAPAVELVDTSKAVP